MTLAELIRRPLKALNPKEKTDPDLDRLLDAANAGGVGVNLATMSDRQIIEHLSRR